MGVLSGKRESFLDKSRLEAMVDGIFSVAMTLLVMNFMDAGATDLPQKEAEEVLRRVIVPVFLDFAICFMILGSFWHATCRTFARIVRTDARHTWIILFAMMNVCLFPFTYSHHSHYGRSLLFAALFHANTLFTGLLFFAGWGYANKKTVLLRDDVTQEDRVMLMRRSLVLPMVALLALGACFFTPGKSSMLYMTLPVVFSLLERWGDRKS